MPPSKQFVDVPTRQTRLYKSVSEDRMELLLDRLRASLQQKIDWVGSCSAVFTGLASFLALAESWKGTGSQIIYLVLTVVFVTIVCWRTGSMWLTTRNQHPMTNEEFLNALAEEQEEDTEKQKESVNDASVKI